MADPSSSRHALFAWIANDGASSLRSPGSSFSSSPSASRSRATADYTMGFGVRALSAAGAAVLSAILVNPLDVAKTRLQAQAAGVPYDNPAQRPFARQRIFSGPNRNMLSDLRCSPSCSRAGIFGAELVCPHDCFEYRGTLDVFRKVVRQEGFARLWRGTNAGLALAVPTVAIYLPCYDIFRNSIEEFTSVNAPILTPHAPLVAGSVARSLACIACSPIELARTRMQAHKEFRKGIKPPGMLKTLIDVLASLRNAGNQKWQGCGILWTGAGAQLARDVPFSAICWSTLEPTRRRLLSVVDQEGNATSVLGANFSAGLMAGSLAAAATCPLDVAKTRRQIEKDPAKAISTTTIQTLVEVWRNEGIKGLYTGVGPRVARAGPSVGIVVSFYEVVKYVLQRTHTD